MISAGVSPSVSAPRTRGRYLDLFLPALFEIAGKAQAAGPDCSAGNLCFSMGEVDLWVNGLLGFFATGLLALATMIVQAVATLTRDRR